MPQLDFVHTAARTKNLGVFAECSPVNRCNMRGEYFPKMGGDTYYSLGYET